MTAERIVDLSMDQFLDGDIDLGDMAEDEIVLLRVRCTNADPWYRADLLANDSEPPSLQLYGPCESKQQALEGAARAGH
jgi:hypothetical protein